MHPFSKSFWKRVATVGTGFLATEVVDTIFDYVLYPVAIAFMGPITGGVIMTVFAVILNYIFVLVYNATDADWFGFEWARMQEEKLHQDIKGKMLRAALKSGRWGAFVFLSWWDPFMAFVFMQGRKPKNYHFTKHDWTIFFAANIIGNLIWITMVSGAVGIVKHFFFGGV